MLVMIGFIFLVAIGVFLCVVTGVIWFGSALFGQKGYEAIVPLVFAALAIYAAFHFAPFHITFTG